MKIIRTDLLNELLDDFKEKKYNEETFQEFVERTQEDGIFLVHDLSLNED